MGGYVKNGYGLSTSEQLIKSLAPIHSVAHLSNTIALKMPTSLMNHQLLNTVKSIAELAKRNNQIINSMGMAKMIESTNIISEMLNPSTMMGINSAVQSLQETVRLQGNMKTTFKGLSLGIDPAIIKTMQDLSINMSGVEEAIQNNLKIFKGLDWSGIIDPEDLKEFGIESVLDGPVIVINEGVSFQQRIVGFANQFKSKYPIIYILLCIFVCSPVQSAIDGAVLNVIRGKTVPIIQEAQTQDYRVIEKNIKIEVNNTLNINIESKDAKDELLKIYYYVSTEKLIMRRSNKVKSKALYTLGFGQVVKIIHKDRNWTLVEYENDEDVIQGWVFTRYISKFKK